MRSVAFASAEASLFGTIATQPLWVIRTRMLLNTNPHLNDYQNLKYSCKQIYRQLGYKGFATGLYLSLLLAGTGVLQMYSYEGSKRLYDKFIPQTALS